MDSLIATRILFRGMAEGWFTGKKLGQYFNEVTDDPRNARQIINGNDQDELIAGYHYQFLEALKAASPGGDVSRRDLHHDDHHHQQFAHDRQRGLSLVVFRSVLVFLGVCFSGQVKNVSMRTSSAKRRVSNSSSFWPTSAERSRQAATSLSSVALRFGEGCFWGFHASSLKRLRENCTHYISRGTAWPLIRATCASLISARSATTPTTTGRRSGRRTNYCATHRPGYLPAAALPDRALSHCLWSRHSAEADMHWTGEGHVATETDTRTQIRMNRDHMFKFDGDTNADWVTMTGICFDGGTRAKSFLQPVPIGD